MTKEEFEQLKSTVKQWLFHTGSLDPTNYANELKLKFIEPREKHIAELKADNDARKFAMTMSEKVEKQLREENKKAEEIIKGLLSFVDSLGNYSGGIFARAEQFLNNEVEK